ncbi:LarC family nickel insertion protein [Actinomadura chibensis]|uniref:LarC family nickel insertion protein n=1 Tax=Actinomadura chibensis TaxID=392828 RepID=A0A5D0NZ36_9ACTN|nr:LarC family nickel insertion protein [Actinomadura chibensis]TYB49592.1 LarC family nickel insertion protein [Actinomadura chibensis]
MTAQSKKIAYFHCFAGIAGDMALGALLDAGADLGEVRAMLKGLDVPGWSLDTERVSRRGIAATRAIVGVEDDAVARNHSVIADLIGSAPLPGRVRDRALAVFRTLAEAEGAVHGTSPDDVHFHEVGGHDAIVDIVGTCAALETLGVDEVRAAPIPVGRGFIRCRHGLIPNPGPAVVELVARARAPIQGHDVEAEMATPTGAALLVTLAARFGAMPSMTVTGNGFGAGTKVFGEFPNVTQVVLGETA